MRVLPVRVSDPDGLPVSLDEAKLHLRQDSDDENDLIIGLISAATEHLDGYSGILGRCVMAQDWQQDFPAFAADMVLDVSPVTKIVSVRYFDASGVRRDVLGARLMATAGRIIVRPPAGETWPQTTVREDAVQVTVTAGYDKVPAPIKQAILLLVGHWYANRESVVTGTIATVLPMSVDRLLAPYRRPPV